LTEVIFVACCFDMTLLIVIHDYYSIAIPRASGKW
jgi:hypothetical protein